MTKTLCCIVNNICCIVNNICCIVNNVCYIVNNVCYIVSNVCCIVKILYCIITKIYIASGKSWCSITYLKYRQNKIYFTDTKYMPLAIIVNQKYCKNITMRMYINKRIT